MDNSYLQCARVFQALCDENRLKILDMLVNGEKCANTLLEALSIRQPTLSHHMKILCESGIVVSRRWGKQTLYSINPDGVRQAYLLLERIVSCSPVEAGLLETVVSSTRKKANRVKQVKRDKKEKPASRPAVRDIESYLL